MSSLHALFGFVLGSFTSYDASASQSIADLISGNTVKVTNQLGVLYLEFSQDGRYVAGAKDGPLTRGDWIVEGRQLCLMQSEPKMPHGYNGVCQNISVTRLGEVWTNMDPKNGKVELVVMPGHSNLSHLDPKQ